MRDFYSIGSLLLMSASLAACASDPSGDVSGAGSVEPLYAMVTLVWTDDGPTGYVALTRSLDESSASLDQAREFPGYTSVGVADGKLLVNPSWEALTIERYSITDELEWLEGGVLGFANEGVEAVSFQTQFMHRGSAAYVNVDVTGRVLWDPIAFGITGNRSDTLLPLKKDGLSLYANLNRTQFLFQDRIFRPFSYHDDDWFRWSAESPIVVYDRTTHDATDVLEAPCPALDAITVDERGNTYLGTHEYSALHPLMGTGAAPCTVRLTPERTIDTSWSSDLTGWTGGRHVVNFRYVGDGRAIATVFHAEEYGEGFDFADLARDSDEFWAVAARFHRLWTFDLDAGTAAPVEGIDAFEFVNPGFFHAVIDGRTFVFLGNGNNDSNNYNQTVVYEIDGKGDATRRFEVEGSVTQWVRVR
jgi:hypothetical protein